MGKIYWDNHEIPQPAGAHIDRTDARVFIYLDEGRPIRESRKITVGHATSETMMYPNDTFKQLYPALWREYYGDGNLNPHVLHCGMFALTLGAGWKTGIYPVLTESFGSRTANLIMDYSMYSIFQHGNAAELFAERLQGQVVFSEKPADEAHLGALFREKMTEEANDRFREAWIRQCMQRGLRKVWLSIDGSNSDCDTSAPELAERGHAKSGKDGRVIGYMYAVSADDGTPVTYMSYNGGKVDSQAVKSMISHLRGHGVEVEGVILDRGFCTHEVFQLLESSGYHYVVMLKSSTEGHRAMMLEHGDEICWNAERLVGMNALFGTSDRKRLFANHPDEAFVTLFFDGRNGTERSMALLNKVFRCLEDAREAIRNHEMPVIPEELKTYLELGQENGIHHVAMKGDRLNRAVAGKGFSSIASSKDLEPSEVNHIYHLRDASEKQFMIMKSQLGSSVFRMHTAEGIKGKIAACFISTVIRHEIMLACQRNSLITNKMLIEIDRMTMMMNENGMYLAIHDETLRQKRLLQYFDILPGDLDHLAADVNRRGSDPVHGTVRMKPEHDSERKVQRGRPVGTTRKKNEEENDPDKPKRGRGRPKGSRNKKTLELERSGLLPAEKVKRGRGRPKGSKNKPKNTDAKRGRGRPKGSKNKPRE